MQKLIQGIQQSLGRPLTAIILAALVFMLPKLIHDNYVYCKEAYMAVTK